MFVLIVLTAVWNFHGEIDRNRHATMAGHRSLRATTRVHGDPTGKRPGLTPPITPTWPIPRLSSAEAVAKRAELLVAIRSTESLPSRELQDEALIRICCEWAEFDPRGAVENAIAWQLEQSPGLLEALALQWASADINSARQWVEMQPASGFRSELVARIGFAMAQETPASAADYVLKESTDRAIADEALCSIVHQWAIRDSKAARSWAESFMSGPILEQTIQNLNGIELYQTNRHPQPTQP